LINSILSINTLQIILEAMREIMES